MKANLPPELEHLRRPLSDVSPDPTNPKLHTDEQVAEIAKSFVEFGQDQPIIAGEDGIIAVGEGRWLAARRLEWEDAAIILRPWREITRLRRNLADNRTHDMSGYDMQVLNELAQRLSDDESGGDVPGFSPYFLEQLAQKVNSQSSTGDNVDESDADEVFGDFDENAVAKFDDFVVFRFGDYRGNVSREVYDSFVAAHSDIQSETDEPMLDDVLRIWLNV